MKHTNSSVAEQPLMDNSSSQDSFKNSKQDHDEIKTTLISRNITVMGKRTSVRLEPEMWKALREISDREQCTIHDVCTLIKMRKNPKTSLTAAIRVFLMLYFRAASNEDGHGIAGHGSFEYMKHRARIPAQMMSYFSKKKYIGQSIHRHSHAPNSMRRYD